MDRSHPAKPLIALTLRLLRDRRGISVVADSHCVSGFDWRHPHSVSKSVSGTRLKRQDQTAGRCRCPIRAPTSAPAGQSYFRHLCPGPSEMRQLNGFPFQSYTCPKHPRPAAQPPQSGQMCANNPPISGKATSATTKAVEGHSKPANRTLF